MAQARPSAAPPRVRLLPRPLPVSASPKTVLAPAPSPPVQSWLRARWRSRPVPRQRGGGPPILQRQDRRHELPRQGSLTWRHRTVPPRHTLSPQSQALGNSRARGADAKVRRETGAPGEREGRRGEVAGLPSRRGLGAGSARVFGLEFGLRISEEEAFPRPLPECCSFAQRPQTPQPFAGRGIAWPGMTTNAQAATACQAPLDPTVPCPQSSTVVSLLSSTRQRKTGHIATQ